MKIGQSTVGDPDPSKRYSKQDQKAQPCCFLIYHLDVKHEINREHIIAAQGEVRQVTGKLVLFLKGNYITHIDSGSLFCSL